MLRPVRRDGSPRRSPRTPADEQKRIPQRSRLPGDAVTPVVTLPTGTDNSGRREMRRGTEGPPRPTEWVKGAAATRQDAETKASRPDRTREPRHRDPTGRGNE